LRYKYIAYLQNHPDVVFCRKNILDLIFMTTK
jgi:hypothetical protein